tara:strand:+ start:852 stop:3320 length:2469 start_codon:yes stop_codon:yes gene_type:complete
MPRIPLYNQGQGSATRLATGQLSRRADTGAFAAPGQASASFARSAGKVVTDFALAERNRKDKILLEDVQNKAIEFAKIKAKEDEGIVDDTTTSKSNFASYKTNFLQDNVENPTLKYNTRQKKFLTRAVDNIFADVSLGAQMTAFDLGTSNATKADNKSLENNLELLATSSPDLPTYQKAFKDSTEIINLAASEGRTLTIPDEETLQKQIKEKRFDNSMLSASSVEEAQRAYRTLSEDESVSLGTKTQASKILKNTVKNIQDQTYKSTLEMFEETSLTADDYSQISQIIKFGENAIYVTSSGQRMVLNVADIGINDRIKLRKISTDGIANFNEERQNFVAEEIINLGFAKGGPEGAVSLAEANYASEQDKENAEKGILASTDYFISQAREQIALSNFDEAQNYVQAAQSLLTTSYSGRDSFIKMAGTTGQTSRNYLDDLSRIKQTIQETSIKNQRVVDVASHISSFSLSSVRHNYTSDEINAGLNMVLSQQTSIPKALNVLQKNSLESEVITNRLNGAYDVADGPSPDFTDREILQSYELYKQINLFGSNMIARHTNEKTRLFFNAAMVFEMNAGKEPADALKFAIQASQKNYTADDTREFRRVFSSTLNDVINDFEGGFAGWFGRPVKNEAQVRTALQELSVNYIKFGLNAKDAVKLSKEDLLSTSMNVNGFIMPKDKTLSKYPIEKLLEYAAIDFAEKNKEEELNIEDITIVPVQNRVDEFQVFIGGPMLLAASDMKNTTYTLTELIELGVGGNFDRLKEVAENHRQKRMETDQTLQDFNFLSPDDMLLGNYHKPFLVNQNSITSNPALELSASDVFGDYP